VANTSRQARIIRHTVVGIARACVLARSIGPDRSEQRTARWDAGAAG
jgi:hypothetical protein